jgi:glycosyltransferase involved in cell wall biosynthesis
MKIKNKLNLGIITFPADGPSKHQLSRLIELFIPLSNELHVITGNEAYNDLNYSEVFFYGLFHNTGKTTFSRIFRYFLTQMKISYYFLKVSKKADIWVFIAGGETLAIPMTISFLLRKKTFLVIGGWMENDNKLKGDMNKINAIILIFFKKISLLLSSKIILYSNSLIERWNLSKYKNKILINNTNFINFDDIKSKNLSEKKKIIIGYIGRLSEEKGVMNFVKSMPNILNKVDVQFLIGGDGPLSNEINDFIKKNNLEDKVISTGWIPHNKICSRINQLNILILPSYTEGLPSIILEAMACGTPVLATDVGAVPDVIRDNETGFIMDDNSIECITKNVIKVLQYEDLQKVVDNAFNLVKKEYSYENTLKKWIKVLNNI